MFRPAQLLLLLSVIGLLTGNDLVSKRISNGQLVLSIRKRPYQVSLAVGEAFRCAGSILSSRWVLTAAHCLINKTEYNVRVGTRFKSKSGRVFKSQRLISHPKFVADKYDCDVGLIDLGEGTIPLNNLTAKAVELMPSGTRLSYGTKIEVSGWGRTDNEGGVVDSLLEISTKVLDFKTCKRRYPWLTRRMICAEPSKKKTCNGDSGGPVVLAKETVLVGIVSFGYKSNDDFCDDEKYPSVFTNVSHPVVRDWITLVTGL